MKELEFGEKLILRINKAAQKLKADLGVMRELGIKNFSDTAVFLESAHGLFEALLCILNRAVKRYNREYNGTEVPFTYTDIVNILPDTAAIKKAELVVRVLFYTALPRKNKEDGVWHEDTVGRQIEPNVDRLYVMGLTVLNVGAEEAKSMTAAEVSELLSEYGYINNFKESPREMCRGKDVEGVGDGDELAKRLAVR